MPNMHFRSIVHRYVASTQFNHVVPLVLDIFHSPYCNIGCEITSIASPKPLPSGCCITHTRVSAVLPAERRCSGLTCISRTVISCSKKINANIGRRKNELSFTCTHTDAHTHTHTKTDWRLNDLPTEELPVHCCTETDPRPVGWLDGSCCCSNKSCICWAPFVLTHTLNDSPCVQVCVCVWCVCVCVC